MRLDQIFEGVLDVGSNGSLDISSIEIDSRKCRPGSLFFAMPGTTTNGVRFIDDAVARGAVGVVSDTQLDLIVPSLSVDSQRIYSVLVRACSTIAGHPENRVSLVGVTGTNGKTSVTTLLSSLWTALGRNGAVIGTLTHERTTPATPELFRELQRIGEMSPAETTTMVALEVSSHALTQSRVDGLKFDVAVFTNLTLDHLDYHETMDAYFDAKASLFVSERCARAVIWIEDPYGQRLAASTSVPFVSVSRDEATDVTMKIGSTEFQWRGHSIRTALSGEYNLDNSLLVLATAVELGVDPGEAAGALSLVPSVPGRFELVSDLGPVVVVDYAHTPDGLTRLLTDVRSLKPDGRILLVFGCGGDRDRTKRPIMGEVATRLADYSIITSDNPRSEDPDEIINEIIEGCHDASKWQRTTDRRMAIREAIRLAGAADTVVIAGKGHEATQTIGSQIHEFDDRLVANEFLR